MTSRTGLSLSLSLCSCADYLSRGGDIHPTDRPTGHCYTLVGTLAVALGRRKKNNRSRESG